MEIKLESIGIIHSPYKELEDMPIQPAAARGVKGQVMLYEKYLPALLLGLAEQPKNRRRPYGPGDFLIE